MPEISTIPQETHPPQPDAPPSPSVDAYTPALDKAAATDPTADAHRQFSEQPEPAVPDKPATDDRADQAGREKAETPPKAAAPSPRPVDHDDDEVIRPRHQPLLPDTPEQDKPPEGSYPLLEAAVGLVVLGTMVQDGKKQEETPAAEPVAASTEIPATAQTEVAVAPGHPDMKDQTPDDPDQETPDTPPTPPETHDQEPQRPTNDEQGEAGAAADAAAPPPTAAGDSGGGGDEPPVEVRTGGEGDEGGDDDDQLDLTGLELVQAELSLMDSLYKQVTRLDNNNEATYPEFNRSGIPSNDPPDTGSETTGYRLPEMSQPAGTARSNPLETITEALTEAVNARQELRDAIETNPNDTGAAAASVARASARVGNELRQLRDNLEAAEESFGLESREAQAARSLLNRANWIREDMEADETDALAARSEANTTGTSEAWIDLAPDQDLPLYVNDRTAALAQQYHGNLPPGEIYDELTLVIRYGIEAALTSAGYDTNNDRHGDTPPTFEQVKEACLRVLDESDLAPMIKSILRPQLGELGQGGVPFDEI